MLYFDEPVGQVPYFDEPVGHAEQQVKIYRGYYMPARGYEFYLRVVNSISS